MYSARYSCQILMRLDFIDRFSKNSLNLIKIVPLAAEVFYEDRQTDSWTNGHDEANNRISQFCERS
jgi:hypothetical protein